MMSIREPSPSRFPPPHECPDPLRVVTPHLRITITKLPGTAVIVRLDGEADQEDRRKLDNALSRALQDRPPRLVVDLSGQTFCYSVCLNALLAARLDANAAGVEMVHQGDRVRSSRWTLRLATR